MPHIGATQQLALNRHKRILLSTFDDMVAPTVGTRGIFYWKKRIVVNEGASRAIRTLKENRV